MTEELNLATYLYICPSKFEIYLFEKNSRKNLYKNQFLFNEKREKIDYEKLRKFLDENIFKIEKLNGEFVQNIILILENIEIFNLNIGIKKKNYGTLVKNNILKNYLTDANELFKENYQNYKILHIIINKYIFNGKSNYIFDDKFEGDNFCMEIEFKSIPISLMNELEKTLEKYQIKISQCIEGNYTQNFFSNKNIDISYMAFKIQNGLNENEVKLIPKNQKKQGFFEKFFQLFS